MKVGAQHDPVTSVLAGYSDQLATIAANREDLLAEFARCVALVEATHRHAEVARGPLRRLQAIDAEIEQLDLAAAALLERCAAALAEPDRE